MHPLSHYLDIFRKNPDLKKEHPDEVRIAFLSSFTIQGLPETVSVVAGDEKLRVRTYTAPYDQYAQTILSEGELYAFKPHLVVLMLDPRTIFGDALLDPYSVDIGARRSLVDDAVTTITGYARNVLSKSDAYFLVHNFAVPSKSPLGIHEEKESYGVKDAVRTFNEKLNAYGRTESRVFVFDYQGWVSQFGTDHIFDPKLYYLGDMRVSPEYFGELAKAYLPYVRALAQRTKKSIVLDLDNTLWGGVIGEDGMAGIKLGPTPEGRPFMEFQQKLLALWRRGVILAVNSNNDAADVLQVLREHPHMVLKEEHFAALQINWDSKVLKMQRLAEDIGIGLDSMVFLDDDTLNRAMVREMLPNVTTPGLPADPAEYVGFLDRLQYFDALSLTKEDKERGVMYAQERQREEFKTITTDLGTYLKGMGIAVRIETASPGTFPRLAQLTQKTNQFNTTTRRFTESELKKMSATQLILAVYVKDRFGDNGLTGVAIVEKGASVWDIPSLLFSCRVIGRGAEDALISHIAHLARKAGAQKLRGELVPTPKNTPVREYYKKNGFTLAKDGDVQMWEYDLKKQIPAPEYITLSIA